MNGLLITTSYCIIQHHIKSYNINIIESNQTIQKEKIKLHHQTFLNFNIYCVLKYSITEYRKIKCQVFYNQFYTSRVDADQM